ncbi:unnamed protein product [Polarella glacialis]|uniref:Acyltransferase 3 domain-containing protein n=2 Tax=Polarella glacialis TaxID=89957 RepID=A0A813GDM3_POLGL|nr:unnamed protein product [Polarella glacialis]
MGVHAPIDNSPEVEVNKCADEKPLAVSNQDLSTRIKTASKKPRIDCIDGCRFALVFPIIVGHFVRFGTKNKLLLKLLTQENVLVGGFFIISGYVSGYVATNMGERKADEKKLKEPELFFWQKVMSYYPLHFLLSTSFAPLFVLVDRWQKNPWSTTRFHALLNYTLLQAWFPSEAEIWNPPTWFLSALTFANALMPTMVLPRVAGLSKHGLRNLLRGLIAISLIQKLSYSQAWRFYCEGGFTTKTNSPLLWNMTRFHPIGALVEITMGIATVREVMLDDTVERSKPVMNPLWLFLASYGTLALRCTRFNLNDAIIRSAFFVPLYSRFLTTMHRDCMTENPSAITRFFGSKTMVWLGSLAFPMFMIHGPLGQLFYKKAVATRLGKGHASEVLPRLPSTRAFVRACSQ